MLKHCKVVNKNKDVVEYILRPRPFESAAYIHERVVRLAGLYECLYVKPPMSNWIEYNFNLYIDDSDDVYLVEITLNNYRDFDFPPNLWEIAGLINAGS